MPKYFFHLCRQGAKFTDQDGQSLKDPDQAWEAARAAALDLMKTEAADGVSWLSYHFEVTDEAGHVLLELPFTEALEITRQPS